MTRIRCLICAVYFPSTFALFWFIQMSFTGFALGVCPPNLPTKIVAEMCKDSAAEGEHVFIDTKYAIQTDNGTGVLCQCSVTFSNQTSKVQYDVTNSRENCGSNLSLNFTDGGVFHATNPTTCSLSVLSDVTEYAEIYLRKTNQPFGVDYCAEMNLRICGDEEFQCSDGTCIDTKSRCDEFPDCSDDELDCSGSSCTEGKEYCNILKKCVDPSQCVVNSSGSAAKEVDQSGPVIRVECMESTRFSTTTTTTTTTSTTPTSTTTQTPTTPSTTVTTATTVKNQLSTVEKSSAVAVSSAQPETTVVMSTEPTSSIMSSESVSSEQSTSAPLETSSMSTGRPIESSNGPGTSTENQLPPLKGSVDVSHNDDVDPLKQPGVIAGIVIGTIIAACVIGMTVWFIQKSRKKNEYQPPDLWIPTDNNKEMSPLNS